MIEQERGEVRAIDQDDEHRTVVPFTATHTLLGSETFNDETLSNGDFNYKAYSVVDWNSAEKSC